MPVREGPHCPGCGLPNYEGLCPVCRGDEQAYMDELHFAFGDFYEGQSRACSTDEGPIGIAAFRSGRYA